MIASRLGASVVTSSLVALFGCGAGGPPATAPMTPATATWQSEPAAAVTKEEAVARAFLDEAARHAFTHPATRFDDKMQSAMTPEAFEKVWSSIEDHLGKLQGIEGARIVTKGRFKVVNLTTRFQRGSEVLRVTVDESGAVAGFFIGEEKAHAAWTPPSYAQPQAFVERDITVGNAPALPGTLTLPKSATKVPAVVLVHGSGPNDRDESIGGMKPFRDLAWGLASQGIAVVRYEKRTRHSPAGVVTMKEESVDGALDAIAAARSIPEIDPAKVYVLGHSQGGFLAPRIAKSDPKLAGVIVLAGSARPLQDLIIDQLQYLGGPLEDARKFKAAVEDPALQPDADVALPFYRGGMVKGAYFIDLRGYDAPAVAKSLAVPMLVLQGERDYQVTSKDFARWKDALSAKRNATLKTYTALNHLFASGSGKSIPAEYEQPSHVDAPVVADIAAWIKSGRL